MILDRLSIGVLLAYCAMKFEVMMRSRLRGWACVVAIALGCGAEQEAAVAGSGGAPGGGSGAAGVGGGGASGVGAGGIGSGSTFTRVWSEVLSAKGCAGEFCHGAGTGSLSLNDKADAYRNLVGVPAQGPACGPSGQLRVSPGKPEESLLLDKIAKEVPSCGDPMPIGVRFDPNCLSPSPAVCTTAGEIELVRAWIAAGALDD
jgi:hypothetical protein